MPGGPGNSGPAPSLMGPRGCQDLPLGCGEPGKGNQRRGSSQSPFVLTQFVDRACPAPRSPPFIPHCATRAQPTEPHQPATRAEPHLGQPKPRRPGGPRTPLPTSGLAPRPRPQPASVTSAPRARCAPKATGPGHPGPSSRDGRLQPRAELRPVSVSVPAGADVTAV